MYEPLIVVLEGPDFAGKSTLAAQLVKLYDGPATVVSNGPPPAEGSVLAFYEAQIADAGARPGLTVFDRLHVGELIYGPIYRGESRITDAERLQMDGELDLLGACKVHVDASDSVLTQRFRGTRGDDLVHELDTLLQIACQYRFLLGDPHAVVPWTAYGVGSDAVAADLLR